MKDTAPNTLDETERDAHDALAGRRSWPALDPVAPPPIADPSEGRSSNAELAALDRALHGSTRDLAASAAEPTRAGYRLQPDGEAVRVLPALAADIMGDALTRRFPDLWAVDAETWRALEHAAPRDRARIWLESPGRRLVQDLDALAAIPAHDRKGATDLSLDRICRAAMFDAADAPAEWRELHDTLPGTAQGDWAPAGDDDGARVERALWCLEHAEPTAVRFAALRWLLGRAAVEPLYRSTVQPIRRSPSITRDLRQELKSILPLAVPRLLHLEPGRASFEDACIEHAARWTPDAAFAWHLALWLASLLPRSPFHGADAEILGARVRALLPASTPQGEDPLHPRWFAATGVSATELAFVSAAAVVVEQPGDACSPALLDALRAMAARVRSPAELSLDRRYAELGSRLGWALPFVSAPRAAQWILSRLGAGWLGGLESSVIEDLLRELATSAADDAAWIAQAILAEADALGPAAQTLAEATWRALPRPGGRVPAILGAAIAHGVQGTTDAATLVTDAQASGPEWRTHALAAIARRARAPETHASAIRALLAIAGAPDASRRERIDAGYFALRGLSEGPPATEDLSADVARALAEPPLSEHVGLRRELSRLGLDRRAKAVKGRT